LVMPEVEVTTTLALPAPAWQPAHVDVSPGAPVLPTGGVGEVAHMMTRGMAARVATFAIRIDLFCIESYSRASADAHTPGTGATTGRRLASRAANARGKGRLRFPGSAAVRNEPAAVTGVLI